MDDVQLIVFDRPLITTKECPMKDSEIIDWIEGEIGSEDDLYDHFHTLPQGDCFSISSEAKRIADVVMSSGKSTHGQRSTLGYVFSAVADEVELRTIRAFAAFLGIDSKALTVAMEPWLDPSAEPLPVIGFDGAQAYIEKINRECLP